MESSTQAASLQIQIVHAPGVTRVTHAPKAANVNRLFTTGDDFLVRILPSQPDPNVEALLIDDATAPVTWIEADNKYLVTASEDGCARVYRHSPLDENSSPTSLVHILRRENLPVRCVALERFVERSKAPRVAVCSDELVIKIIDVQDPRRIQLLTGHSRAVRAASWSPVAPILITCSADGVARVWDMSDSEPTQIKLIDGILPPARPESEVSSYACWHPSGAYFVLPSKTHELFVFSALTSVGPLASSNNNHAWIKTGSFVAGAGGSVSPPTGIIHSLAFSPNGRYLAVGTADGQITIWEASSRQAIRARKAEGLITGISWHPTKDSIAWTDNGGSLTRWSDVVGSTYPSPYEEIEFEVNRASTARKQRDQVDDLFVGTGLDDDDDGFAGQDLAGENRRKQAGGDDGIDNDLDDFVIDDDGQGHYRRSSSSGRRKKDAGSRTTLVQDTKPQAAFQPTSTPMQAQRRYLAFNMLGSVTARDQDAHQTISFESYDTSARRNFRFTDHFNYNMASLSPQGVLFACKQQGETRSSIYFKPFESWNNIDAEWTLNLGLGEDVDAIALGGAANRSRSSSDMDDQDDASGDGAAKSSQGIVIVATSKGYLRFLSTSGMQLYLWAIGHPIVAMAAGSKTAIIIYRSLGGALDGYQGLGYSVIDLTNFDILQEGILPLTKGTHIRWVAFNDQQQPAIYDSQGILFVLDRAHRCRQGRWIPVLDTTLLKENQSLFSEAGARAINSLNYWPVAMTSKQLMVLILKGGRTSPEVDGSRHLIQEVDLEIPLINRESGTVQYEEKSLRDSLLSSAVRDSKNAGIEMENRFDSALESNTLEMSADKSLLQLIQLACKADRHARALDAARCLHSTRTLDAALQIAAFFHLPSLADRLTSLKEDLQDRPRRAEEESKRWCDPRVRGGPSYSNPIQSFSHRSNIHSTPDSLSSSAVRKRASAALGQEFLVPSTTTRSTPRRSFASSLDRFDSPVSSASPQPNGLTSDSFDSVLADKENGMRGEKRKSIGITRFDDDDHEDTVDRQQQDDDDNDDIHPLPRIPKPSSKPLNPFARTSSHRTSSSDKSLHKSNSFFERIEEKEKQPSKQSTLTKFASKRSKTDNHSVNSKGKEKETESIVSAFGETQPEEEDENGEESLKLTL